MISAILFLDNLGGGELLVILLFTLFFFGSKKIPDIARGLGRAGREFKDAMNSVQREIEDNVRIQDKKPLENIPEIKPEPDPRAKEISESKAPE
jgi:sec-independent protein translocase protein TatA